MRVFAQVDTSQDIYVGENFPYNIIIDGDNRPGEVDLTPLAKYSPRGAGNRDVSQTSITFDGRNTRQTVIKRYVMSYTLVCQEPGRVQLPPVTIRLDGKDYQTNPVEVNVLQPGTTDKLDIEVLFSESQCYVGQPVVMTVRWYVSAELGDFSFNTPVFGSDDFYIEDVDVGGRPAGKQFRWRIQGVEVHASQQRVVHEGRQSDLVSFSKVLIPRRSGQIQLEPVTVSADLVVGRSRSRRGFFDNWFGSKEYKRFLVSSKPVTLTVLPLPEQGRPANFYGLVGRYTIAASASPTKVNVGDPITLSVRIGGSRYLKPVQWPELEQVPGFAEDFKIPSERSSPTVEGGFKVFVQTIRASNERVGEIPPIPLTFFDPEKGQYVVARSEPIKLEVAPTKMLTGADMEGTGVVAVNKEVEAIKKGLKANYEGDDALVDMSFSPAAAVVSPGYAVGWAVPLGALCLSLLLKFVGRTSPEVEAAKRRRSAYRRAVHQLKGIAAADPKQRHELLGSVMKQYVGDRFDRVAGSLTGDDCREIILRVTGDTGAANSYRQMIASCEAARYASLGADVDGGMVGEVTELLRSVERKVRK